VADVQMTEDEKRRDGVAKVLGEPVFLEFPDATQKARRNLLAMGAIAVAFAWWRLELTTAPTVLGFQLQNLSTAVFAWGLLWSLVYLLVHFVWLAWDALQEWRIRQSGTRVAFQTGARFGSADADSPSDPRQSSLYRWWLDQQRSLGRITEEMERTSRAVQVLSDKAGAPIDDRTGALLLTIQTNTASVGGAVKHTSTVLESHRVPVSLERFDNAFRRFAKSQNARWILLEFGTPVLVGAAGIIACICMLTRSAGALPVTTPPAMPASTPVLQSPAQPMPTVVAPTPPSATSAR
jgi:hypothetical protein